MKRPIEILTPLDMRLLLMKANGPQYGSHFIQARHRAVLMVLYRAGLRLSECLDLRPADVEFGRKTIHVRHGKGDRARFVGMDDATAEAILAWSKYRNRESEYLFCTEQGRRLNDRVVRRSLARLAKKACIPRRVHPHGFRHTHACELAAENVPMNVISKQLGHARVSTTHEYIQHVNPQDVIDAVSSRKWGG